MKETDIVDLLLAAKKLEITQIIINIDLPDSIKAGLLVRGYNYRCLGGNTTLFLN